MTSTSIAPGPLIVPANTAAPTPLATGTDSPVIGASSTSDAPEVTLPSSAIRSPGRTRIVSPTPTSSTCVRVSAPPFSTDASAGDRAISPFTDRRTRSRLARSSACATANRNSTDAPSDQAPIPAAPSAARVIRTLMSNESRPSPAIPFRATSAPAASIAAP